MATRAKNTPTPLPIAERVTRWKGPTGRYLEPGDTFRATGVRGELRFVAFVDSPTDPHVEAVDTKKKVRAIRPGAITTTSKQRESR